MSDEKKQLAKILLKRRVVVEADLEKTLAEGGAEPLAAKLIARGLVREPDVLRGLSEQYGVPAVDLERVGLNTQHLVLAEAFAKKNKALILFADETRVLVATVTPDDPALLREVSQLTGRVATPYVALPLPLHRAIERAYAAAKAGEPAYYGRHARTAESPTTLLTLATFLPPERRDDEAAVFTDDGLRAAADEEPLSERMHEPARPSSHGVDVDALLEAGAKAFRDQRPAEALDYLQEAVRAKPDSFRARYQLGLMLGQQGRLHEAITEVERATLLDPACFPALKNLALLHEKAGFRGRAVEAWRRALPHAPDDATRMRVEGHLSKLET